MSDDIFTTVETNDDVIPENPLEALVGDGKKYKTIEDLAKAALEKDRFILQLQSEGSELRKELQEKLTMDEIMTQIRKSTPPQQSQAGTPPQNEPAKPQEPDIEALVASMLEKKESEKKTLTNKQIVQQKLESAWGADAQINLNKKARELQVSVEYLAQVASQSPAAFFRLVNLDQQPSPAPVGAPRSGVSPTTNTGSNVRNRKYYDDLKNKMRADGKLAEYFGPAIQNQMYKDAMALGPDF